MICLFKVGQRGHPENAVNFAFHNLLFQLVEVFIRRRNEPDTAFVGNLFNHSGFIEYCYPNFIASLIGG